MVFGLKSNYDENVVVPLSQISPIQIPTDNYGKTMQKGAQKVAVLTSSP
jgi:hypothetical protein